MSEITRTQKSHGSGGICHDCAPQEFRQTPNITGSFELDAVIAANKNKDIPSRLSFYVDRSQNLYGPRTGYDGYHGYSGDD